MWQNAYIERPQVVQDKQGNPLALFLGMSKLDGYSDSVSWSSKFCAPGQVRIQPVRFPAKLRKERGSLDHHLVIVLASLTTLF